MTTDRQFVRLKFKSIEKFLEINVHVKDFLGMQALATAKNLSTTEIFTLLGTTRVLAVPCSIYCGRQGYKDGYFTYHDLHLHVGFEGISTADGRFAMYDVFDATHNPNFETVFKYLQALKANGWQDEIKVDYWEDFRVHDDEFPPDVEYRFLEEDP